MQTFRISLYVVKSLQNIVFKLTVFKNLKRNLNCLLQIVFYQTILQNNLLK